MARLGGLLMAVGSVQFILCMLAGEAMYPGYSPLHNYISDLGALRAPTAPLFNASVALLGVMTAAAALLLRGKGRVARALLALAGVGAVGVGLFPEDYGAPHALSALVAFLFGALAAAALGLGERGALRTLGLLAAAVSLAALALFVPRVPTPLGIGGVERLVAYPVLLYAAAYGLSQLRRPA